MTESLEGKWKEFTFKMIEKDDHPKVIRNFQQVFCKDEPLLRLARITESPETLEDMANFLNYILSKNDNLSFCVLDKAGEIAALRITMKGTPAEHIELPLEPKTQMMKNILRNLSEISDKANIYEYYGIQFCADLIATSVNPEYRGQGLVTEIYKRSFDLFRAKGYSICKSTFTSPITHAVAIKYKFQEHARKLFLEFTDENGHQLLPHAKPEEKAVLMALKL